MTQYLLFIPKWLRESEWHAECIMPAAIAQVLQATSQPLEEFGIFRISDADARSIVAAGGGVMPSSADLMTLEQLIPVPTSWRALRERIVNDRRLPPVLQHFAFNEPFLLGEDNLPSLSLPEFEDSVIPADPEPRTNWANRAGAGMDAEAARRNFRATGRDVIVGVIDSGVDPKHTWIKDNLLAFAQTAKDGTIIKEGIENAFESDERFHGTHTTGIICANSSAPGMEGISIGIAPGAKIVSVCSLAGGEASVESVLRGIRFALSKGASIINLSISAVGLHPLFLGPIIETLAGNALLVAAIGNVIGGENGNTRSPGNLPGVIGVGNLNVRGEVEIRSGGNSRLQIPAAGIFEEYTKPDFVAPGVDVWSSIATDAVGDQFEAKTGTSMAAPQVVGLIALLMEKQPGLTFGDVYHLLKRGCEPAMPEIDPHFGWGAVNARKSLQELLGQ